MKAHTLGQQLATRGGVDRIYASSLGRTVATAKAISQYTRAPIAQVTDQLHPWHLGGLEGQDVTPDKIDLLHSLIRDNPDLPIPGRGPISTSDGESFNDFKSRVIPVYDQLLREHRANPGERTVVVTHSRNLKLMNAWLRKGAKPDQETDNSDMMADSDTPGAIQRVSYDPRIGYQTNEVDPKSQGMLPGGIYMVRHEATPWNRTDDPATGSTS